MPLLSKVFLALGSAALRAPFFIPVRLGEQAHHAPGNENALVEDESTITLVLGERREQVSNLLYWIY
jgi:hypothetical protein